MNTIRAGIFIGINNYDGAPLRGARPDAERMSKFFKGKYDYVEEYYDEAATEENITNCFDGFRAVFEKEKKKRQKGVFVFFFSGHGVEREGRQYIGLPDGNEVDLALVERKTRIPGVDRIFILDCCRVVAPGKNKTWIKIIDWTLTIGAVLTGNWWYLAARSVGKYIAEHSEDCPAECGSCITIASCARGQASVDTPKGGVFTKALLSVLNRKEINSIDGFNCAFSGKFKGEDKQKPCIEIPLGANFSLLPSWDEARGANTNRTTKTSKKKSAANKNIGKEKEKPFFMEIEYVFSPRRGCKVVAGKINGGIIRIGDDVEIIGNSCNVSTKVTGIALYDKKGNSKGLFNEAHPGVFAECLLKSVRNLTKVKEGCVLKKKSF